MSGRPPRPEWEAIDALLRNGSGPAEVARTAGVSHGYARHRAKLLRQELGQESGTDSSCPRFARDDEFQALVRRHGGMPRLHPDGLPILVGADGRPWRELRR